LRDQYQEKLLEIELESRDWLRKNAVELPGPKLMEFRNLMSKSQNFDAQLPEIQGDLVAKLQPEDIGGKRELRDEWDQLESDLAANEAKRKELKMDRGRNDRLSEMNEAQLQGDLGGTGASEYSSPIL